METALVPMATALQRQDEFETLISSNWTPRDPGAGQRPLLIKYAGVAAPQSAIEEDANWSSPKCFLIGPP
ncbi:hypothetical protein SRHO_G00055670 [Serrasalmus rhombeus]